MTDSLPPLFFEVYEPLPRQGPGNRASTERAFRACDGLPPAPRVLDLGCGSGAQTVDLAALTDGPIVAVDAHAPNVERCRQRAAAAGVGDRVEARVGDMAALGLPASSVDLVWSEGALYNIGLEAAFALCHELLRAGGYLAFTDAVWRTADAPEDVRAAFADYATMGTVDDVLRLAERSCAERTERAGTIGAGGWEVVAHFPLPDAAWWDDFYTPMEARIAELQATYADDAEALGVLDMIAAEPEMHRRSGSHYGYEFFVLRKA